MNSKLRNLIGREEFDYPALMAALASYANPRSKVTSLLRQGTIIRIKKGLYIFGDDLRRRPFSRELLANLIYGPSYVSLDSALSYHGLIPERVAAVTSITTKREKRFATPVGLFIYRRAPMCSFHLGMVRVEQDEYSFLIAGPERALADKLRDDRGAAVRSQRELENYLFTDLRLDRARLSAFNLELLGEIGQAMGSRKIELCYRLLQRLEGKQ